METPLATNLDLAGLSDEAIMAQERLAKRQATRGGSDASGSKAPASSG